MKFSKKLLASMIMIIGISAGTHIQAAYPTWADFEARGSGSAVNLFKSIISSNTEAVHGAMVSISPKVAESSIFGTLQSLTEKIVTSPKATDAYGVVTVQSYRSGTDTLPALCEVINGLAHALAAKYNNSADPDHYDAESVEALVAAHVPEVIDALVLKLNSQFVLVFVTQAQLETARSGILSAFFAATKGLADVAQDIRGCNQDWQKELAERARATRVEEDRKAEELRKKTVEEKVQAQLKKVGEFNAWLTALEKANLQPRYRSIRSFWIGTYGKSVEELKQLRKELAELEHHLTVDEVGAGVALDDLIARRLKLLERIGEALKVQDARDDAYAKAAEQLDADEKLVAAAEKLVASAAVRALLEAAAKPTESKK